MGYGTIAKQREATRKRKETRLRALPQRIERHMNFEYPELEGLTPDEVVHFVVETIARFVSPPKFAGEDEEFSCEDLAGAIRALESEIKSRL